MTRRQMRNGFLPGTPTLLAAIAVAVAVAVPAHANDTRELTGVPLVLNSDTIMLGGQTLSLWGISTLAADQQCWHDHSPWACGEQATTALKHYVENHRITCEPKDRPINGPIHAQCFREKGKRRVDVARHLIRHGWAMDFPEESKGYYQAIQNEARLKRRGIWTSRFQTADDWRDGIQRYVDYGKVQSAAVPSKAPSSKRMSPKNTAVSRTE